MHFTVVFHSHESADASYSLVFVPCPIWMRGEREVVNLNPESPSYQPGSVRRLLDLEYQHLGAALAPSRACAVVVHQTGHGTQADLDTLLADLAAEGFAAVTCSIPD